jgi:hypothetical protein
MQLGGLNKDSVEECAEKVKFWRQRIGSLRAWLIGNWLSGEKILRKAMGVGIEKFADSIGVRGTKNESGVMILFHAINDFWIGVSRSVGLLLAR